MNKFYINDIVLNTLGRSFMVMDISTSKGIYILQDLTDGRKLEILLNIVNHEGTLDHKSMSKRLFKEYLNG